MPLRCAGDRIRTGDLVRDRDPGTARLPYARNTLMICDRAHLTIVAASPR